MNLIKSSRIKVLFDILKSFFNKKSFIKGFTLVELLVVLAILIVLIGIGVPAYLTYKESSEETADLATLKALNNAGLVLDATQQITDKNKNKFAEKVAEAVKGVEKSELTANYDNSSKWCIGYGGKCVDEEGDVDETKNTCSAKGECQ